MISIKQFLLRPPLVNSIQKCNVQYVSKGDYKLMKIGMTGDPFKTTIKRKKELIDPNKPKYLNNEAMECLKWANWHTFKDLKKRWIISEHYPTRVSLLHLFKYKSLPYELRENSFDIIANKMPRKSRWRSGRIRYHCILTGRPKGRVMRYRVSRFIFRALADYNRLSGVIKGKW